MHLEIILPTDRTERTASSVVSKLYSLAYEDPISGSQLDSTSNIVGSIGVPAAYDSHIQYLTTKYQDLHISADSIYIMFLDPEVERVLLAGNFSTDGIGVTSQDAAAATFTNNTFKNNTTLVSFNEFNLFTKANNNPPQDLFYGCTNLESINLSNITKLGKNEFKGTKLSSVTIPSGVTEISSNCFNGCTSLASVSIPQSLVSLENSAFYGCSSLTTFDFANIVSISSSAFLNSGLTINELSIPNLVGNLGNATFRKCAIRSITNLGNITAISPSARYGYAEGAFLNCTSLTSVTLPSTLISICSGFGSCTSLTTVNGNLLNLISITNSAFSSTKISSIPNMTGLLTIGTDAFFNCTLLSVAVNCPNLTTLGNRAFGRSAITQVVNLGSVTEIPLECFSQCTSLTSVTLPSSCISIGKAAFEGCSSITSLDLTNITSFLIRSFNGVGCTKLSFPNLTSIPNLAFYSYPAPLTTVEFGSSLQSIGTEPFWGSLIKNIIFHSTTVPSYTDQYNRNFLYNMSGVTIYVPDASLNDYKTTGLWANMANNIKGLSELPY